MRPPLYRLSYSAAGEDGFEPPTVAFKVRRATDCATRPIVDEPMVVPDRAAPTPCLVPSGGLEPPSPSLKGWHPGSLDDDGEIFGAGCENRTRITGLEARGTANIPNPQWRRAEDTILTDFRRPSA